MHDPTEQWSPTRVANELRRHVETSYQHVNDTVKDVLIRVCTTMLEAEPGLDALVALKRVREKYTWPFSDRTFFVGPWKSAKMRISRSSTRRLETDGRCSERLPTARGLAVELPDNDEYVRVRYVQGEHRLFVRLSIDDDSKLEGIIVELMQIAMKRLIQSKENSS